MNYTSEIVIPQPNSRSKVHPGSRSGADATRLGFDILHWFGERAPLGTENWNEECRMKNGGGRNKFLARPTMLTQPGLPTELHPRTTMRQFLRAPRRFPPLALPDLAFPPPLWGRVRVGGACVRQLAVTPTQPSPIEGEGKTEWDVLWLRLRRARCSVLLSASFFAPRKDSHPSPRQLHSLPPCGLTITHKYVVRAKPYCAERQVFDAWYLF
jgi:hypothetical protein